MRALFACTMMIAVAAADAPKPTRWDFDADKADAKPAGFTFARTGTGAVGTWTVKKVDDAPSGKHVLAQTDADKTSNRFPIAIADAPSGADVTVSVKCKPISGKVDQTCGLARATRTRTTTT